MDARELHRLRERVAADRRGRLGQLGAVGERVRGAGEHRAQLVVGVPGEPRRLERDQERRGLLPVRVVARVDDLLGRDLAVEVEQVDRAPRRGVEEDALAAGHAACELGEVGDAGVRDDQRRLRVAVDERAQPVGDRRQAAAAVDQDRHAPLGGDLEDGREPLVGGGELLRARVQLDAARAGVEAAARLLDRRLVQVEADERDQPAAAPLGERERAVVRGA